MCVCESVSTKALHYAAAGGSAPSALFLLQRSAMARSLGYGSRVFPSRDLGFGV